MSNRAANKKGNSAFEITQVEGHETATGMVTILSNPPMSIRFHRFGMLDGRQYFDSVDGTHIEMNGPVAFLMQTPLPGHTIDENGRHRELRKEESAIIQ